MEGNRLLTTERKLWKSRKFCIFGIGLLFIFITLSVYLYLPLSDKEDENFDYVTFSQQYPVAYCITWSEGSKKNCSFPEDRHLWSVHGIWPTKTGTVGPNYCKRIPFNVNELTPIIDELRKHWASIDGESDVKFWEHEWKKHGSCAAETSKLNTEIKYFKIGLEWNKKYDINTYLQNAGIYPNDSKSYELEDFQNAIKKATGFNPAIHCVKDKVRNVYLVSELYLCFSKDLILTDCHDYGLKSDCPETELYYPSNVAFTLPS